MLLSRHCSRTPRNMPRSSTVCTWGTILSSDSRPSTGGSQNVSAALSPNIYNRQTDTHTDRHTYRQTDTHTDGQTDRQTDNLVVCPSSCQQLRPEKLQTHQIMAEENNRNVLQNARCQLSNPIQWVYFRQWGPYITIGKRSSATAVKQCNAPD